MFSMNRSTDLHDLVEHWTLLGDENDLVAGKRGGTRLAFALQLKFYTLNRRFPVGPEDFTADEVEFVARQVRVERERLVDHDWVGRTARHHQMQIRQYLGVRECSVADADRLTAWLGSKVGIAAATPAEIRSMLLDRCRQERIEPPTSGRVERIVRSSLRSAESALTAGIAGRLSPSAVHQLNALIANDAAEGQAPKRDVLSGIKSVPGNVSLDSMLTEISKLRAVRTVGLPAGMFDDVSPKLVTAWRARAMVESPSHLRDHNEALRLTLMAALIHCREREITDTLVDLLIATVHRIGARADKKVTQELVNAFKRVTGVKGQ